MKTRNFNTATAGTALLAVILVPAGVVQAAPAKHHRAKSAISGVVIHNNTAAHSFVVAEHSGKLDAIHGPQRHVGEKVRVEVSKLANGTFASKKLKVVEHPKRRSTTVQGVVTASDPANHEVVISGTGSSIRVSDDPATTTGDTTPAVGETVDANVEVERDGQIKADDITSTGQSQAFRVEGKVLAIDVQTRTLTITADDDGASVQSTHVAMPDSFDLTAFNVGDCVELTVTKAADGTLVALQSFGDDNAREADNQGHHGRGRGGPSGDQSDHHQDGDHRGGDQHGGDQASGSNDAQSGSSDSPHSGHGGSGTTGAAPGTRSDSSGSPAATGGDTGSGSGHR